MKFDLSHSERWWLFLEDKKIHFSINNKEEHLFYYVVNADDEPISVFLEDLLEKKHKVDKELILCQIIDMLTESGYNTGL